MSAHSLTLFARRITALAVVTAGLLGPAAEARAGSLVAGVIGRKKITFDIWGDTVNTASRMESSCEQGKIQISETTYHLIKGSYLTEERGKVDIKGKGMMKTYYLLGRAT